MQTLKEFIISCGNDFNDELVGSLSRDLDLIASSIHVKKARQEKKIPSEVAYKAEFEEHEMLIDIIVDYFMTAEISDALVCGYIDGGQLLNVSDSYACPGVSFTVQLLKSPLFKLIHETLGSQDFLNLLFCYEAYIGNNGGLKLWGPIEEPKFKFNRDHMSSIDTKMMMYKGENSLRGENPLPETVRLCLRQIFPDDIQVGEGIPKRFKKIGKILEEALANHNRQMMEYPYILESICGKVCVEGNNYLEMATSKKKVIRFLMIVIDKIFPIEHIGTASNKAILASSIAHFVHISLGEQIDFKDLSKGLKLNNIGWVKPRNGVKMTKPEFLRAQLMLEWYIKWFFERFLSKLIGSFFHVTEASQSKRLYFYRHEVWTSISQRFKGRYFMTHLEKSERSINSLESFFENDDFIAKLKLLPKVKSFRLIAAPFRGSYDERFGYMEFQREYMKPLGRVLQSVRSIHGSSISSVSALIQSVAQFKRRLVKGGKLPKLYGMKFDVKQAYDSVPIDLVKKVLKRKLDDYSPTTDRIVVRQYQSVDDQDIVNPRKRRKITSEQVQTMKEMETRSKSGTNLDYFIQKSGPFVFSKAEIVDFVDSQLSRMSIFYHRTTYTRKVGLFQGFQLSGILFNMVYDSVIDFMKESVKVAPGSPTEIFRLVDDFLVLSTDKEIIQRLKKLISRPIAMFNLNVNRLKTKCSDTSLSFVALELNIKELSFVKKSDVYNNEAVSLRSFSKLYKRLEFSFEMRLKSPLFSERFNTDEAISTNIINLYEAMTLKFIASHKLIRSGDRFSKQDFASSLERQLHVLEARIGISRLRNLGLNRTRIEEVVYDLLKAHRVI
ncbi:DEKNAAC101667 [Brettanomyces naardenensis]|uniref:Telomerase reverse transcriptase n=1 Tax=Brettanomyces naardenensis TaxID=13370 RepID=A0A448YIP7_BRENA|nr:DEKNAAC101667 [Brettanomyces naardenensis]